MVNKKLLENLYGNLKINNMKLQLEIWNFTIVNLDVTRKYFVFDLLEYNEISLLTILINKSYKRVEILTLGKTF